MGTRLEKVGSPHVANEAITTPNTFQHFPLGFEGEGKYVAGCGCFETERRGEQKLRFEKA